MNDFLQSLRGAKDKRFDKNRRPYTNPQYRNPDNRSGADRKPPYGRFVTLEQVQAVIGEALPVLKSLLETLSESQKRQAEANERIAKAEELKAESLKSLSEYLRGRGAPEISQNEAAEIVETAAGDGESASAPVSEPPEPESPAPPAESASPALPKNRSEVARYILELRNAGGSYEGIARQLDTLGIPTVSGKGKWRGQMIQRLYQEAAV